MNFLHKYKANIKKIFKIFIDFNYIVNLNIYGTVTHKIYILPMSVSLRAKMENVKNIRDIDIESKSKLTRSVGLADIFFMSFGGQAPPEIG